MKNEGIEMISYNKISYQSDAFIDLSGLESYINFIVDENYSTQTLSLDKYTAGSSDNPDDFSLPEFNHITKPQSLLRMNPFHKNSKSSILLKSSNQVLKDYPFIDESNQEDIEKIPYVSDEALEMLRYFEKNFIDIAQSKTYDYSNLSIVDKINKYVIFLLNERYFSQNIQQNPDNTLFQISEKSEDYGLDPMNPRSINNQNVTNNNFESSNISNNEIENIFKEIQNNTSVTETNYVYNSKNINLKNNLLNRSKTVRFTLQNITQNYISEVKNEIIESVTNMFNIFETKVKNENITKIEVNNIKNEILNYFENKLETHTEKVLQEHEEKTKAEIKSMFKNFLNS